MMEVGDFPFVASLAHWIWGRCQSDQDINYTISPEICLNQIPFLSWHCLEPIITKFAGVGIIVGSCFNKAPTILNLFQARSAEGFSRFSVYSETLFYTNCSIYSIVMKYPLTAYGENLALLIQTLVIVCLVWKFEKVPLLEQISIALLFLGYVLGIFWILPSNWRYVLHGVSDIVIILSGGAQIFETYRVKHTGAQSIVSTSMNLAGEVLRIVTTVVETNGDINMLLSFAICTILSVIIFVQYFWYCQNTERFFWEQEKKKTQ